MKGDIIRRRRKEMGLSQQKLAEMIGVSRPMLSHLERGRRVPSIQVFLYLAHHLKVHPDFLLSEMTGLPLKSIEYLVENQRAFLLFRDLIYRVSKGEITVEGLAEVTKGALDAAQELFKQSKKNHNVILDDARKIIELLRLLATVGRVERIQTDKGIKTRIVGGWGSIYRKQARIKGRNP